VSSNIQANLTDRAMLITLTISVWTARKYDRGASDEVAATNGTSKDMGRYHKRLIGDNAASVTLKTVSTAAREFHYMYTLPWSTEGARILPVSAYMTYIEKMREYKQAFDEAADQFVSDYPTLRENAKALLGRLYNEDDYPHEVADRFKFRYAILPFPDSGDFRVHLTADEIEAIKEQITDEVQTATAKAMKDVWERFYKAISHMVDRLSQPDAIFRNSLFDNVQELCNLLPKLNLTNDPKLTALSQDIASTLLSWTPDNVRQSAIDRQAVASQAAAIQKKIAAYMGV
jgi:hypothetical protein